MIRTYTELSRLLTFEERFNYLKLTGAVGQDTFGHDRYLNQILYRSPLWKETRRKVILRDNGCDLGLEGYEIAGRGIIHHMNPITVEDVLEHRSEVFDPEFLILCSHDTHNAIHYGELQDRQKLPIQRTKNDTCPWK